MPRDFYEISDLCNTAVVNGSGTSARAHLGLGSDDLVDAEALADLVPDWKSFLGEGLGVKERDAIRAGERTGRPLGSKRFIEKLERKLGRRLLPQKAGRKPQKAGRKPTKGKKRAA